MKASNKKMAKKKAAKKSVKPAPKKAVTPKAKPTAKPKTAPPAPAAKPVAKKKKTATKAVPAAKKTAPKPAAKPTPVKQKAAAKKTPPKPAPKKAATKPVPAPAAKAAKKKTLKADPKPKAAKKKVTAPKPAAKKTVTKPSPPAKPKAAVKKNATKPKAAKAKSGKKAATTVAPKKAVRKAATKAKPHIPAILLEGDAAPDAPRSGPGARYDLGPDAARPHGTSGEETGELPAAYGTGMLVATARDPHWLYVFWDLTDAQQMTHNKVSRDGHLILRLFSIKDAGRKTSETHVHPESRNWFVPVPHGGQKYSVEIGYYTKAGTWQSIFESRTVATPPDSLAVDNSVDFVTLPVEIPFEQLLATVRQVVSESVPLMEALEQLRTEGYEALPGPDYFKRIFRDAAGMTDIADLTPSQKEALAEVITMDEVRRVWIGSHEITELVKGQLVKELASQAAAAVGGARALSSAGASSLSSPFGGDSAGPRDFWFNVNAELIIYGATEPDAAVTIGGRRIQLRADGSFSYRFALPDGQFDLPIQATNAEGDDSRNADLAFSRDTRYRGDVGTHAQDERLKTPRPENTV